MLNPQGPIGTAERGLMLHTIELMLIVAVPVYILIFFFAWKYRASNTSAKYMPEWEHSKMDELVWWAIPLEIVLVLAALTWTSTHELNPPNPIASDTPGMTIEVVALPWKWLFIYPEQGIATVGGLTIPVGTPITFKVTADAPMNSFWIPQLGGQIYAMSGMVTTLNLMASSPGTYSGYSSNYSGDGFASMGFKATAVPQGDFDSWVAQTKEGVMALNYPTYQSLAQPGTIDAPFSYASVADDLYDKILMQFMSPPSVPGTDMSSMPGMRM